jgi:glycosyltransferase involved in cell wall biosynthesis
VRVLHVHSGNLYGGVETFLVTLVREARFAPRMLSMFAVCFEGRLSAELTAMGRAPHSLGRVRLSRPATLWRARRVLKQYLRQEPFDVVVCHQAWASVVFAPAIREAGLPLVLWVHMAGDGRHWLDQLARRRVPDLAICNSRFSGERLSKWLRGIPLECIYYPVSLAPAGAGVAERSLIREQLRTDPSDVVIVQVSRLEAWKGQHVAIAALATLKDLRDWTYWIVGGPQRSSEGRYLRDLQKRVQELGIADRVRFAGERQDVATVLRSADIFCQPNTEPEPFGLSLLEALRAGLPVVTSASGGASEIVDETCGALAPPNDARAVGAALRRLVTNASLREQLARQGQARPLQLCDPAVQMPRIEQVLSAVARPAMSAAMPA